MNTIAQKKLQNKAIAIANMVNTTATNTDAIKKNLTLLISALEFAGREKYLPILYALADKLAASQHKTVSKNYSLYQGNMETVYLLIQVAKIADNATYLEKALEIAKGCNAEFLHSSEIANGLYAGKAGALLTLLHLYDASPQKWILAYIKTYAEKIIQDTIITPKGAYWDYNNRTIKGSCDFAEGTAGIAFVFRELASYFNNPAFGLVADWATTYENSQWNSAHKNWANYKKQISSKEELDTYIEAYKHGKMETFSPNFNDFSWKHGCSGIILGATKSSNAQQTSHIAELAEKIAQENHHYENDEQFFGIVRTLFYAGNHLKNNNYKEKARSLLCDQLKNIKDETSLALLCFEIHNDDLQASLHCPFISNQNTVKQSFEFDEATIKKLLLARTFPKSLEFLEKVAPEAFKKFLHEGKNIADFTMLLYSSYGEIATLEDTSFQMEILLEKEQFEMFTPHRNNVFNWIEKIVMQHYFSEAYAKNEAAVFNRELMLNTDTMSIVKISNIEDIDITDYREHPLEAFISYGIDSFMLQITDKGTIHRTSLQMIKLVYASFMKKNTIQKVGDELIQFLSHQNPHIIQGVRRTLFMHDDEDFEAGFKKALTKITVDMAYNGILKPVDGKLWA
ncbi:lanthionine synthetase LanC family protein [Kordia jejudonensis]|uniref:lanthionine synthetase LanC family protein n=1 Tax=Kordia jejudonensis TaxID=1348245 RepID=UPI00062949B3|nr:lanthionine synthetase LanC family protein [Kordia jejudonensis]